MLIFLSKKLKFFQPTADTPKGGCAEEKRFALFGTAIRGLSRSNPSVGRSPHRQTFLSYLSALLAGHRVTSKEQGIVEHPRRHGGYFCEGRSMPAGTNF